MPSYKAKSRLGKELTRNIRESNQNEKGNQYVNAQHTELKTE